MIDAQRMMQQVMRATREAKKRRPTIGTTVSRGRFNIVDVTYPNGGPRSHVEYLHRDLTLEETLATLATY